MSGRLMRLRPRFSSWEADLPLMGAERRLKQIMLGGILLTSGPISCAKTQPSAGGWIHNHPFWVFIDVLGGAPPPALAGAIAAFTPAPGLGLGLMARCTVCLSVVAKMPGISSAGWRRLCLAFTYGSQTTSSPPSTTERWLDNRLGFGKG